MTYHGHTIQVRKDQLGYWHWRVLDTSGATVARSRPPARAVWFGHMWRFGAVMAARKSIDTGLGAWVEVPS